MFVIRSKENPNVIKSFGYTDEAGKLGEFDPENFEEVELDELPKDFISYEEPVLAYGTELIAFINETTFDKLNDTQAYNLIVKLQPLLLFLQQGRCNPMSVATKEMALGVLDSLVTNGNNKLLKDLILIWEKEKVFKRKFKNPKKEKTAILGSTPSVDL